jgi:hypothetical protein
MFKKEKKKSLFNILQETNADKSLSFLLKLAPTFPPELVLKPNPLQKAKPKTTDHKKKKKTRLKSFVEVNTLFNLNTI